MEKYIVRQEVEYGCIIYSVINTEIDVRVNYFKDRESVERFAERQNSCKRRKRR